MERRKFQLICQDSIFTTFSPGRKREGEKRERDSGLDVPIIEKGEETFRRKEKVEKT